MVEYKDSNYTNINRFKRKITTDIFTMKLLQIKESCFVKMNNTLEREKKISNMYVSFEKL